MSEIKGDTATTAALDEPVQLRAGTLAMAFEPWSGQLRAIAAGQTEIVRGIYATVRDRNWGTVQPVITNLAMDVDDDRFTVTFDAVHQRDDIDYRWHGRIEGNADSTIRYTFDGQAHTRFQRNRIGFCVLHPLTCARQRCHVEHVDGRQTDGRFPELIAPHQPFLGLRTIRHAFAPDRWASVRMEGDTFEMEDQRNWTDASFKTYCTPLAEPFPVSVQAGDRVRQQIIVSLEPAETGGAPARQGTVQQAVHITRTGEPAALPRLGLEATPGHEHRAAELAQLRPLQPDHLRVAVRPATSGWQAAAGAGLDAAAALRCGVELALFVRDADAELPALDAWLDERRPTLHRVLLFHADRHCTAPELIAQARQQLGRHLDGVDLAVGTDAFFTELNRDRPDPAGPFDALTWSINPQVHAFDDRSLIETLEAQAHTVRSAQALGPGKRVGVSPVTLKMRWSPHGTSEPEPPSAAALPDAADPRQLTAFAAVWTLGSLKHLAQAGVASITCHQTVGYLGVMEREAGSPLPEQWPARTGARYPVGDALAELGERRDVRLIPATSSQPLVADALLLERAGHCEALLINYTARPQRVRVDEGPAIELPPHGWKMV